MDQSNNKRKVFFENISSKTITESLKVYLSKEYQIEVCNVHKSDRNKGYGTVIFFDEANVNRLMNKRPYQIDGREVEVYRCVSGQGSLKEKKGVKNLIVYNLQNKIRQSDLQIYFAKYGKIHHIEMNDKDSSCRIEFNDYDSVDKALLDVPHIIDFIRIELKKGDHNYQLTTDSEILSRKRYCIHISNISSKLDAECLSRLFQWPIYNIVMYPSSKKHLSTECWLKHIHDQKIAENFIEEWNGQIIDQSEIRCQMEEDKTELCKYFQVAEHTENDSDCDWQHIKCSEYKTCSTSDCLYGHAKGVKTEMIDSKETYRIKIMGFRTELTRELLAQLLDYKEVNRCYINPSHNQIGYIVNLKSTKFARYLFEKWHNKEIEDGQKLKCQLELNIFPFTLKPHPKLASALNTSYYYQTSNYSTSSSRSSSLFEDGNDFKSDDRKAHNSGNKNFTQTMETLIKYPIFNTEPKESLTESTTSFGATKLQLPNRMLYNKWEIMMKVEESHEQVLLIREKMGQKHLAVIKIYQNNNVKYYKNELKALKILEDINNVSQLIDYSSDKTNPWIIMERAPGCSLKEFIHEEYHNNLGILEAIQLTQQLLNVVKHVHCKGIFHRNLNPEHIMIKWNFKITSIKQAYLTLINFSQAYFISEKIDSIEFLSKQSWYQSSQANVEAFQCSSTIDASSICAILFWLITKIDLQYNYNTVLQQDYVQNKVIQVVENTNLKKINSIEIEQLKIYLIDTFNIAFGYSKYQPWTINDLEIRLESIRELLLPSNPKFITHEAIFQHLSSIHKKPSSIFSMKNSIHQDIFEKASNAFVQGKKLFSEYNQNLYSWSEENCTWLNSTINERRHDDILTYRNILPSYSIIITCLATVNDRENLITLSIGSSVNGKIIRIPIGQYNKTENYITEFPDKFIIGLKYLIISIYKQRKAIES